jgi:hypothetical protein
MAITATTLSAAIGATDSSVLLASISGVAAPNFQGNATPGTGSVSYLFVEQEWMQVISVGASASVPVGVKRGVLGSNAQPHGASCPVAAGLSNDFPAPTISVRAFQDTAPQLVGFSAPVAGANTNTATGPFFHLTGTVIMKTLNPPTIIGGSDFEGAAITIVFDGSAAGLTWDATGNIAVAGTATTAGSAVTFWFDQGSGKWHPSRLA